MKTYIKAKSKRDFEELIKAYRHKGYMLISYGLKMAELEKQNIMIVIER